MILVDRDGIKMLQVTEGKKVAENDSLNKIVNSLDLKIH